MLAEAVLADQAESLRAALLREASRRGRFGKSSEDQAVDASLLWLCQPFAVVTPEQPCFLDTVDQVVAQLEFGGGIRRYATDTYYGGGAWPVLTASLGWYQVAAGKLDDADRCLEWVASRIDDQGHLAEQFGGELRDPANYGKWVDRWGPPAADLLWSHAMHVVLATEIDERLTGSRPQPGGASNLPNRQT